MLTAALYAKLTAASALTDLLPTYTPVGGAGSQPAIFQAEVPEDAILPYVVLVGPVGDSELDDKTDHSGRDVLYQIDVYAAKSGSVLPLEAICEAVRSALHRQALTVSGLTHVETEIAGPIVNDQDETYGRALTARMIFTGA